MLGAWLHGQRISFRKGTLSKEHERKLDAQFDGWRQGRSHRRAGDKTSHAAVKAMHGAPAQHRHAID
jgi:hypothetical protein